MPRNELVASGFRPAKEDSDAEDDKDIVELVSISRMNGTTHSY